MKSLIGFCVAAAAVFLSALRGTAAQAQAVTPAPDWPEDLIAAPLNHKLLFENEAVRVLDTIVKPGETVTLHTHRWPSTLYIMSWSDFVRRDGEGTVMVDSRAGGKLTEGSAVWSGPLAPHTLENVGTRELRSISVEVKCAL